MKKQLFYLMALVVKIQQNNIIKNLVCKVAVQATYIPSFFNLHRPYYLTLFHRLFQVLLKSVLFLFLVLGVFF